jgi:arsenite methyltransferase
MSSIRFDSEVSQQVEAVSMTVDLAEQRRKIGCALALRPGDRVLDVGVGPGVLAAEMAAEVGPQGRVCGVDISESMLNLAARRAAVSNGARVELDKADAINLPYGISSFDLVVASQLLEYVDDVPAALFEARRVLRAGGRIVVLDTDWDSIVWHSRDDRRMARVLTAFEEHASHPRLPRRLPELLASGGFTVTHMEAIPLLNVGYHPRSYSAGLVDIVARFVAGRAGVNGPEAQAWADDLRSLGPRYFFSLNRYLFVGSAI